MKEVSIIKQLKMLDRKSKKTREFILKSQSVHGDKYIYDLVVYDNCRTKVKIVCPTHGIFGQSPDAHLYKSSGCEQCSRDAHRLTEIPPDRLKNIMTIHNNKYSYVDLSVNSGKIKVTCPTHGEFSQSIYHHENGHGCYDCEKESRIKTRTKVCKSCNIDKPKSDFLPKYRICKECCDKLLIYFIYFRKLSH